MSEDSLNNFSLDELFGLMVKTMDELLALPKDQRHDDEAKQKRKQMGALQKMTAVKRSQIQPLNNKLFHWPSCSSLLNSSRLFSIYDEV